MCKMFYYVKDDKQSAIRFAVEYYTYISESKRSDPIVVKLNEQIEKW